MLSRLHGVYKASRPFSMLFSVSLPMCTLSSLSFFFPCPPSRRRRVSGSHWRISYRVYVHTAAKLVFVQLFRHSHHLHSHTVLGWTVWTSLCFIGVVVGVVLAIAVPIFLYLIGIAAALFAAWYTYGLAGFFWLSDTYRLKGGMDAIKRRPIGAALAVLTILAGASICVAGTYIFVKLIAESYASGLVGKPFVC
ncbi:hypothetical protein PAXRUDRAFT_637401 [Paxillus rubicundulus Ve08.2h10]|uniref:Uncharacterized protein n=1 Tax=Paxillus rubicundulus Ve08.2h10 TaxID=930991 RepID=A0A0D0DVG4_9AGAM|nr:hypothetical protein PAXRUDRAFT_637401 [Paxillus rubicundulus Ve08.2h10]